MRGGRNKFGPMYKRDRARKLQVMRERQLTTPRGSAGGGGGSGSAAGMNSSPNNSNSGAGGQHSAAGMYDMSHYSPSAGVYGGVKHEIQIPQVSSLTSSPDSSPSPLTAASLYPGRHANSKNAVYFFDTVSTPFVCIYIDSSIDTAVYICVCVCV